MVKGFTSAAPCEFLLSEEDVLISTSWSREGPLTFQPTSVSAQQPQDAVPVPDHILCVFSWARDVLPWKEWALGAGGTLSLVGMRMSHLPRTGFCEIRLGRKGYSGSHGPIALVAGAGSHMASPVSEQRPGRKWG